MQMRKCFMPREYKSNAATQVLAMGLMRQFNRRMRVEPVILDTRGEIPQQYILRLNDTGKCSLYYNKSQFSTECGLVPRENVDDILGGMDCTSMSHFLALNKIAMSKGSDQEMILRAFMMGRGGLGPRTSRALERVAGWICNLILMRSIGKAIENMPAFINGVARGVGPDGSVLNRVATAAEMIAAGYKEVSPGKWTLVKVLENRLPDSVKNATVYTLYEAMPDTLKEIFRLNHESGLYKMGNALSTTIQNSTNVACDFIGRACEIAGFTQPPNYYFEDGVLKKAAQKVVGGLNVAKDAFETATGTSILGDSAKEIVKDMLIEGCGGAILSVGLDLAGSAIGYFFDSSLTPAQSIIGGAAVKYLQGEGSTLDTAVNKAGIAVVAAEGFGKATGTYVIRKGVYSIARLIPCPIPTP
jgi:hypothetical protein